jgi:hypothetical protein
VYDRFSFYELFIFIFQGIVNQLLVIVLGQSGHDPWGVMSLSISLYPLLMPACLS